MKTKITTTIDGIKIIVGIGEAQIDPKATEPLAEAELITTKEFTDVLAKKKEIEPLVISARLSFENASKMFQLERKATNQSDKTRYAAEKNKYAFEYQSARTLIASKETELAAMEAPLKEKRKELMLKHAVYFTPKQGENIITEEDAIIITDKMIEAAQAGKFLDENMKMIDDYRGIVVWSKPVDKWISREITKINDKPKPDEKTIQELDDKQRKEIADQHERERIAALTTQQKTDEKAIRISGVTSMAAQKKVELEINGATASAALTEAKAWRDTEVAKIETLYA